MSLKNTVLSALQGGRIYFDTNVIIYFIEQHQPFYSATESVFQLVGLDELSAFTGNITLTEILIKPYAENNTGVIQDLKNLLFEDQFFTLIHLSQSTFMQAADIGGTLGLRPLDALHFSSAMDANCTHFLTNDKRFKSSRGIQVVQLGDLL